MGLKVDSLVEGFPAEKIGLKPGDRITSIDEKEIKEWNTLLQMVIAGQGKPMVIEWMRGHERFVSTVEPQKDEKERCRPYWCKIQGKDRSQTIWFVRLVHRRHKKGYY